MTVVDVNVVVSCTDSKTANPLPELRLRHYSACDAPTRVRRWTEALTKTDINSKPALELYKGSHWAVARQMSEMPPPGVRPVVWVCSAGYGLIPITEKLRAYSATFSPGLPDSVVIQGTRNSRRQVSQEWWAALAESPRLRESRPGQPPKSLKDLAARNPSTPIMVVGSAHYIEALVSDLNDASTALRSIELLTIFTGAECQLGHLSDNRMPFHGGFQAIPETGERILAGAYPSLNIRAAYRALEMADQTGLRADALRKAFKALGRGAPPPTRPIRNRVSVSEAENFIRGRLDMDPQIGHTRLLYEFRRNGSAFEYTRFRDIVARVRGDLESVTSSRPLDVAKGAT